MRSEVRDGMRIEWDAAIEMDDGITLRADVFRPDDDGRYPVVLSHGPYGKGLAFQEAYAYQWESMTRDHPDIAAGSSNKYQVWELVDPEKWVPDGYVCVRVDSRGAGRSPGYLDIFSERETRDFYDCVEWAGTQPWSNGKVGLLGISYYAMNQWQVAGLRPPHLAAICPWEGAADWYRDATRHGGIMCTFFPNWYPVQVLSVQHGVGTRGPTNANNGELVAGPDTLSDEALEANRARVLDDLRAHPLDDDYYAARSGDLEQIEVPLLSSANWGGQGLHSRGNYEGFLRAGSAQKWLEVHGYEHWTEFYTDYGVRLQKRFFGRFLKGNEADWADQPPVLLQVRTLDGFVERHEQEWPLARTQWTKLYLDPAARSLSAEPAAASAAIEYEALGDGVTFTSAPFEEETEITGPVAAKLFMSSSTADADVFAVLRLIDPNGDEELFVSAVDPKAPLSQGWLRASHRKLDPARSTDYRPYHTHDELQPLTPGEVYELDVEIWDTCIVAPAGYRIALTILGRDYQHDHDGPWPVMYDRPMRGSGGFLHDDPEDRPADVFGQSYTLHAGGATPAYLLLPVIPST